MYTFKTNSRVVNNYTYNNGEMCDNFMHVLCMRLPAKELVSNMVTFAGSPGPTSLIAKTVIVKLVSELGRQVRKFLFVFSINDVSLFPPVVFIMVTL